MILQISQICKAQKYCQHLFPLGFMTRLVKREYDSTVKKLLIEYSWNKPLKFRLWGSLSRAKALPCYWKFFDQTEWALHLWSSFIQLSFKANIKTSFSPLTAFKKAHSIPTKQPQTCQVVLEKFELKDLLLDDWCVLTCWLVVRCRVNEWSRCVSIDSIFIFGPRYFIIMRH